MIRMLIKPNNCKLANCFEIKMIKTISIRNPKLKLINAIIKFIYNNIFHKHVCSIYITFIDA